jgi:hypothetical protein
VQPEKTDGRRTMTNTVVIRVGLADDTSVEKEDLKVTREKGMGKCCQKRKNVSLFNTIDLLTE